MAEDMRQVRRIWKSKDLLAKKNEITNLIKSGLSRGEIAKKYGISRETLNRQLYNWKVLNPKLARSHRVAYLTANKDQIISLIENKLSMQEIAKRYQVSRLTLSSSLALWGISPEVRARDRKMRYEKVIELVRNGCKLNDIVKATNFSLATINKIIKKYGIKRNHRNPEEELLFWKIFDLMKNHRVLTSKIAGIGSHKLGKFLKKVKLSRSRYFPINKVFNLTNYNYYFISKRSMILFLAQKYNPGIVNKSSLTHFLRRNFEDKYVKKFYELIKDKMENREKMTE